MKINNTISLISLSVEKDYVNQFVTCIRNWVTLFNINKPVNKIFER